MHHLKVITRHNKTFSISERDEREISRDLEDMIHHLDGTATLNEVEGD